MLNLANSRFNPKPGILDFWTEFRKPNPYRWPILIVSSLPFAGIFWWLSGETVYKDPERPSVTYITTLADNRSDAEIMAENAANQELKDLRQAEEERLAQRKRDLYKALGAATGMDVDAIEARADAERAKAEAEEKKRQDAMFGAQGSSDAGDNRSGEGGAH